MLNEKGNIEELFSTRFKDAEAMPSEDIWAKLESNLDKQNVEGLYQTAFNNAVVEPSASVWKKLSSMLALRAFLTFKFNTFNIYYASIIAAFFGATTYNAVQEREWQGWERRNIREVASSTPVKENKTSVTIDEIQNEETDYVVTKENLSESNHVATTKSTRETGHSSAPQHITSVNVPEAIPTTDGKGKKNASENARNVDWQYVKISGANSICKDVASVYSIEGLTVHADVTWKLPKSAKKTSDAGHNVSIMWQESGEQMLSAVVNVDGNKKTFDYVVNVEGVTIPSIKGKTKVCQGMEKQLYFVDENINKEISYMWESQQNTIDQIGNKYINVDWTKSGKDTLFVTKINTVTGCKSSVAIGILIYPQPKIDFECHPLGDNQFEFAYSESQRKGYTYEWNIEGMEYTEPTVTHVATGTGSSFVTLSVTDKNGCVTKKVKEIDFNKNHISIPSKFTPEGGNYFIPYTNSDLQNYRIEIYNARNEKIWESTELNNGKPAVGWDGKYKGNIVPGGKYLWKISATFEDGTKWKGLIQPNGTCQPNGIFILEN